MEDGILQVWWRNTHVGTFEITSVDMWYMEGLWAPNETDEARQFKSLVSSFNLKEVYSHPEKGTRVILKNASHDSGTHCLVIAFLTENNLFIRGVFEDKAVQWLIDNVK